MKSLWTPWTVLGILLFALAILVFNGVINFDTPDISLTSNDIRPPNVRSFRINGVQVGDVIAVIDSVVLTPAELEDPGSMATGNAITFEADISDENRVVQAKLTLFRLLPLPERPQPYKEFDLLETPYRLEWDASDAPNGLYGVSIKVIDENQNEATVYPNVQLALLRFGGQTNTLPPPSTTTPTTSNQVTTPPANTSPANTPAATTTPNTTTANTSPANTSPANTSPATTSAATTPARTLRRRDVVFAVFTTIFVLLLVVSSRLFMSSWSS